ncbi:MAG: leucine-rich repeat protein, partial [Muribaculaceae bacterium]|nr:leucine-rich repeat protein [Muribaculaceae bacterium]
VDIKSITLPSSVTEIGASTFEDCKGLTSINIPSSVRAIGYSAFGGCLGLTSVTVPNSVLTIGEYAFAGCSTLTSIVIGNSVQTIGNSAFQDCPKLSSFTLRDGEGNVTFGTNMFGHYFYPNNAPVTYLYLGRPNSSSAFKGLSITSLTLGNTLTRVEPNEFAGYTSLKSLALGSNITNIGESAFSGCTSLSEVVLPPAVDSIGASAFAGISSLAKIAMGSKVKVIGEKAFDGASAKQVYITAQTPPAAPNNTFSSYSGKLYLQDAGDKKVIDAYYDALTCWDRFESYAMVAPTSIEGDNKKVAGKPGDTIQLSAKLMPGNVSLPNIFWRSTTPEVATVNNDGLVTLLAANENADCKIIAESLYAGDNLTLEWSVSVGNYIAVESITVEPTSWAGIVDEQKQLTVTVLPEDATDKSVTWNSSNTIVATVDNSGLVKLLAEGNCTITVSTCDGSNLKAECVITSESGIDDIFADDNATFDVYNLKGILLHKECDKATLKQLQPGVYVIRTATEAKTILLR